MWKGSSEMGFEAGFREVAMGRDSWGIVLSNGKARAKAKWQHLGQGSQSWLRIGISPLT